MILVRRGCFPVSSRLVVRMYVYLVCMSYVDHGPNKYLPTFKIKKLHHVKKGIYLLIVYHGIFYTYIHGICFIYSRDGGLPSFLGVTNKRPVPDAHQSSLLTEVCLLSYPCVRTPFDCTLLKELLTEKISGPSAPGKMSPLLFKTCTEVGR